MISIVSGFAKNFCQFVCCGFLFVRLGHTRATCHSPRGLSLPCDARSRRDVSSIFSPAGRTARTNENLWAALTVGFQCVREHSQWTNVSRLRGGEEVKQIPSAGRNPPVVRVKDAPLSSQLKYTRHTHTHTQYEKDSQEGGGWATQARF